MNIVFDLGGVVFDWNPKKLLDRHFEDSQIQHLVRKQLIEHADWVALDRGTLDIDDAVARGAERCDLPRSDIRNLMDEVPASLMPFHDTIELIRSVRETDNKLFVLSNMQSDSIAYLEATHDIWDMFDGIVISCRIQMVKPEPGIYEYLLSEHRLVAEQTVFIDDLSENLAAARAFGIQTIQFKDAAQCRQDLVGLACL